MKRIYLLIVAAALACSVPVSNLHSSAAGPLVVLYPKPNTVLPNVGFLQTYIAVQTASPSTCAYSEKDSEFSSMKGFSNSHDSVYHTSLIDPVAGAATTYFVRCRDAAGKISDSQAVTVSVSAAPSTNVVGNLRAIGIGATRVLLQWSDPDPGRSSSFSIYRNGVLVGLATGPAYIDSTPAPGTLYYYSVRDNFGSAAGPASPEAPAMTSSVARAAASPDPGDRVTLDDFESGALRIVNAAETRQDQKNLWGQYPYVDLAHTFVSIGSAQTTNEDAHEGNFSLRDTLTGELPAVPFLFRRPGSAYLQFYPYTGKDNRWHFLSEYITKGKWKRDTYNRLRFWIKAPQQFGALRAAPGRMNMNVGTYVRSSNGNPMGSGGAESGVGGSHYYHNYNIPYSGEWHQVIVDWHPHHQRGGAGNFEWGEMQYPTGEAGFNYFDALTRFYLDFSSGALESLSGYPASFYFDDFELYHEVNPENVEQVYALNGYFSVANNRLYIGWSHPKDDGNTKHEVRYAFRDVFQIGWNAATRAPEGLITPPGDVYNLMEYTTSALPTKGHDVLYVAIKPENSNSFRQISFPLHTRTEGGQGPR